MSTKVEWRQGETGSGSVYVFSPKPTLTRSMPAQRNVVLEVPKLDGAILQTLGITVRTIEVNGVIVVPVPNFDNLMEAKKSLETGIGSGIGQLHVISNFGQTNSKHYYYKGIVDNVIRWDEQKNMSWLDYSFSIICPDPTEYTYV